MALPSLLPALLLMVTSRGILADTCPDRDAISSFNRTAFLGRWYTVKQTAVQGKNNSTLECLSMLVKPAGDSTERLSTHTRYVDHPHVAIHVKLGVLFKEDSNSTSGKYVYARRISDTGSSKKYYILDTDYNNYAVTWYCFPSRVPGEVTEVYSVLSRQTSLDTELSTAAGAHLPEGRYVELSHDGCATHGRSSSTSNEVVESDSTSASSAEDE